jgi:hypothetical protein
VKLLALEISLSIVIAIMLSINTILLMPKFSKQSPIRLVLGFLNAVILFGGYILFAETENNFCVNTKNLLYFSIFIFPSLAVLILTVYLILKKKINL